MLIQEMHIELDLVVKRIASKSFLRILPQEKDWFLNMAIEQFINSKRDPITDPTHLGMEGNKTHYEDLRTLLETVTLTCYKYDNETVFADLPANFFGLDSDGSSNVSINCSGINKIETPTTLQYIIVPITNLGDDFASYTISEVGGKVLASHTGSVPNNLIFEVVKEILYKLRSNLEYEVYWETFDDKTYDNSFILVKKVPSSITSLNCTSSSTTVTYNFSSLNRTLVNFTTFKNQVGINRLGKSGDINDMNKYSFTKTNADYPLMSLKGNKIYISTNNQFTVTSVEINYVGLPRPVNLALNWNCNLPTPTHTKIVGLAAQKLAAYKGYGNYEAIMNENKLKG